MPEAYAELGPAIDAALTQIGDPYVDIERRPDDAGWVSGRLAEILPVPAVHKQHCLELDDPVERLSYLRPMFEIGYR
jgi:Lon protease-like protein